MYEFCIFANMNKTSILYSAIFITMTATSCGEKHEEATLLLQEIHNDYAKGLYEKALNGVDSLRRTYPEAVKQRKEALIIHQQASLALAQNNLATVDSTLQQIEREYNTLKPRIDERHNQGVATAEELHYFNLLRARRDSLQGVFNMECAKIKYIHKRQKEAEDFDAQKSKQN